MDDGFSETAAAHRIHLGFHQAGQVVGDLLIGNGGTQAFGHELSGVMMLEFLGWQDAADLVTKGLSAAIADKQVTYDLARLMEPQVDPVSCSGFAEAIIQRF